MSSGLLAVGRVWVCFSLHMGFFFMKGSLIHFRHFDCSGEDLYLEVLGGTKKSL